MTDKFVEIETNWLTLIGEHYKDDTERTIEYWRVEKADSLIVIPTFREKFVIPKKYYRPGINADTYDFPGGRFCAATSATDIARELLKRELGIEHSHVASVHKLNVEGYLINSSFSNQKLFGVVAVLNKNCLENITLEFVEDTGYLAVLNKLKCLQCRQVLIDYLQWSKTR
jgi:8-oxo-dGTP pyrophosphatase MutT (NUDIX family)